jgi:hypothetical protein
MRDSIKVWVGVNPNGQVMDCMSFRSAEMCWHKLSKNSPISAEDYESQGYTVQPYTLTHGHKE